MSRRALLALLVCAGLAAGALAGAVTASGAGSPAARASVGGGVSVVVSPGWHLIRRPITRVVIPIPRLAMATFAVRLAAHPCACDWPNIANFPRDGGFVLIWEYPRVAPRDLRYFPHRPAAFAITSVTPRTHVCDGPSAVIGFREGDRAFDVEIYLGPAAGRRTRDRLLAALDSLRVAPGRS